MIVDALLIAGLISAAAFVVLLTAMAAGVVLGGQISAPIPAPRGRNFRRGLLWRDDPDWWRE